MHRNLIAAVPLCLLLGACAGPQKVEPWEKGYLAKPIMSFEPDPLAARIKSQVYLSKEAAIGGGAVGASACGCN